MNTVIGVDPSMTRTGVAVWHNGKVSTYSINTSTGDGPRVARERIILGRIMPWVGLREPHGEGWPEWSPDATSVTAVVEAVHMVPQKRGRTSLDLAGLHDVIVYGFHARRVPVAVVVPQHLKQFATANGAANKAAMVEAARALLGISVTNHDEADALWAMALGVVCGGGRINEWPPVPKQGWGQADADRLAGLCSKVQWIRRDEESPS